MAPGIWCGILRREWEFHKRCRRVGEIKKNIIDLLGDQGDGELLVYRVVRSGNHNAFPFNIFPASQIVEAYV